MRGDLSPLSVPFFVQFPMNKDFDLAIIGSGFGGSLLSLIARRMGLSVVLLERGTHPRFAIGESTSPLANLIIEQLAERYDLPRLTPLTQYGDWKRAYPEITCGLKRGFSYFKHEAGQRYQPAPNRANQLLVAASPHDELADTHWLRADVDHFLVREAVALGVEYLDRTELQSIAWPTAETARLSGQRLGREIKINARLVIDASGPRGFLSRQLQIPETVFAGYPKTQALFSHFIGVRRCDDMPDYQVSAQPPYPIDDAALHHVFDSGWMWVLRFDNGVTSAGVALKDDFAREMKLAEGQRAWPRLLARFPSVFEQFAEAEAIRGFDYAPRLSYRASRAAGANWAMLPYAAAFIDPLFSTGIPLTLLGIERLGRILEGGIERKDLSACLHDYETETLFEADHTAQFIGACFAAMPKFENFVAYSMFYFAAASFSEMARRLSRTHLAQGFLGARHSQFGVSMRSFAQRLSNPDSKLEPGAFTSEVAKEIDLLNIAGLCDVRKQNWYDVELQDLIINASKLELSADEMNRIIQTAAWAKIPA